MGRALAALFFVGLAACGGAQTVTKEDRSEGKARQIEQLFSEAGVAMDALDATTAEAKLNQAKVELDSPDAKRHPDRSFLADDLGKHETRLVAVKKEIARIELEKKIELQKLRLEERVAKLKETRAVLDDPDKVSRDSIEALVNARADLDAVLNEGAELEPQSKAYASAASSAREKTKDISAIAQQANKVAAFREGPLHAAIEAHELQGKAKTSQDLEEQKTLLVDARLKLEACAKSGKDMLGKTSELTKMRFRSHSSTLGSKDIVSGCAKEAKSVAKWIGKVDQKRKAEAKKKEKAAKVAQKKKRN